LLFGGSVTRKPRDPSSRKVMRVPVGFTVDAKDLNEQVRIELGLDEPGNFGASGTNDTGPRPVTIRAFRVEEEVPRYKQEVVDLPAEEYIRPGWYGDSWHPAKVGEAYQYFFKTGAITDPYHVSGPGGASLPVTGNNLSDAIAEGAGLTNLDGQKAD